MCNERMSKGVGSQGAVFAYCSLQSLAVLGLYEIGLSVSQLRNAIVSHEDYRGAEGSGWKFTFNRLLV